MNPKRWYQLPWLFLRQNWLFGLVLALFAGIFALVFSLYNLEMEAVAYAVGLCALAGGILLVIQFIRFCQTHHKRQQLLSNIELEFDTLPPARTLAESDYQEMIRALGDICTRHQTQWQQERQESLDYYTTWVHQIKTPISVMQMTLQAEDTEEHRELLAELFRIEQYVEMVLSYIRLGSGHSDLVIREQYLDDIIKQAIRKYASQFIHRKLRLVYEPTDAVVITDEKWLQFILEQLLSNAVKYTREGSVTITVSPDKRLSVADTGIGIAPEDLPRIFEKGFTGYNGRADKKATGLGLYLAQTAAKKLNCTLTAQSQPGVGSVFTLDLAHDPLVVE